MTNEELAKAARQGNQGALPQLWEATRALLFALAWKFYTRQGKDRCAQRGVTLEDLQQEAFFALCDAVGAFDEGKGYQFTTYLSRATENRFRACMGIRGKKDPLNAADRLERPVPWDEEGLEEGDLLPDPAAQEALEAVDDAAQQEQLQAVLGEALEALPAPQGDVLRCGSWASAPGSKPPTLWASPWQTCAGRSKRPWCSCVGGPLCACWERTSWRAQPTTERGGTVGTTSRAV